MGKIISRLILIEDMQELREKNCLEVQGDTPKARGSELIFSLCETFHTEVVMINQDEQPLSFEEELAQDVLKIITVFSARLYGSRSHKNRKLVETLREAVE